MKRVMAAMIVTIMFSVSTWSAYFAKAEIDLNELNSAKELAMIIPDLHQSLYLNGQDRSGNVSMCEYIAKLGPSHVENEIYYVQIDFSFRGSQKACADMQVGSNLLLEELVNIPKVKIGPVQKESAVASAAFIK